MKHVPVALDRVSARKPLDSYTNTRARRPKNTVCLQVGIGSDYTPDEVEFLLAVDRYKRENRKPFPALTEILAVARGLGYRKVVDPGTEASP